MPYKSKEEKTQAELRRYRARRARGIEILGGKCSSCGSTEELEFDHIDPTLKSGNISRFQNKKFFEELKKCQLLCKKCHRVKTNKPFWDAREHGTHAMYNRGKCRCPKCREFFNAYRRDLRRRKKTVPA